MLAGTLSICTKLGLERSRAIAWREENSLGLRHANTLILTTKFFNIQNHRILGCPIITSQRHSATSILHRNLAFRRCK